MSLKLTMIAEYKSHANTFAHIERETMCGHMYVKRVRQMTSSLLSPSTGAELSQ